MMECKIKIIFFTLFVQFLLISGVPKSEKSDLEDIRYLEEEEDQYAKYEQLLNNSINNILQKVPDPIQTTLTVLDFGNNNSLISGALHLTNLDLTGQKSLIPKSIKIYGDRFGIVSTPDRLCIKLTLPGLSFSTFYLADFTFLDVVPFWGHGQLNFLLIVKQIQIDANFSVLSTPKEVEDIHFNYNIENVHLNISGLYNNRQLSKLVEDAANLLLKDFLNHMSKTIGTVLGVIVKLVINFVLKIEK